MEKTSEFLIDRTGENKWEIGFYKKGGWEKVVVYRTREKAMEMLKIFNGNTRATVSEARIAEIITKNVRKYPNTEGREFSFIDGISLSSVSKAIKEEIDA